MPKSMIIHDKRLQGTPTLDGVDHIFEVGPHDRIDWALMRIQNYAKAHGGIERLLILCHGYERIYQDPRAQASFQIGGLGLALCREGLTLSNVALTRRLRGHVRDIIVYACAPADTHTGLGGSRWDGQRFCGELAIHTGANVYASSATQVYYTIGRRNLIDFRTWEGMVYRFTPDGRPSAVVESNPLG